jgi:hypothetical protein
LAGPEDCAEAVVIVIATMAKANIIFRILNHLLSVFSFFTSADECTAPLVEYP